MSTANPIEAAEIPAHMREGLTSAAQRQAFGRLASAPAPKPAAKKATKKATKKRAKQSE